jgi:aldose 1-epimerase
MMANEATDNEIILASGDLRVRVSPFGASLRGMWRETANGIQEVITGYSGAKNKVGGQGDVLIPFPGRVRDGKYSFNGASYEMTRNDKDGPNAIHGFVRLKTWVTSLNNGESATFTTSIAPEDAPGYPFALTITVCYTLRDSGLQCEFTVKNEGDQLAPVAAGFHPYFTVGSDLIDLDLLTLPFNAFLEFQNLLPTGNIVPVEGTPHDFRTRQTIAGTVFNTCFVAPLPDDDGKTRIRLSTTDGKRAVTVWMDASFGYVVLYSGDPLPETHRRRSLAIEPMTCGTDAFNHPEWGLVTLSPGAIFKGAWGVTPEFGDGA